MLLAVNIGNTNISFGIFDDKNLIKTFRFPSDKNQPQNYYKEILHGELEQLSIGHCIISSVADELNDSIESSVNDVCKIKSEMLTYKTQTGINLCVEHPETVGADRIANAAAANAIYPKPAIVIDSGTATTFDIIDKQGNFTGGIIMPGLDMQLESLFRNTSKLPKIKIDKINTAIGKNTKDSILSGVVRASACAIEGMILQCEKEMGDKAYLIGTGGNCKFISEYMNRKIDCINPILTLEGLRIIYNNKH